MSSSYTTITDDSPVRPFAPPTKKLRSSHGNNNNNSINNNHESSSRGGGSVANNYSNNNNNGRDRFSVETDEAIAKRRAELRRLKEKRGERSTTGAAPRATERTDGRRLATTSAAGAVAPQSQWGIPPTGHRPLASSGLPPRNNHTAATAAVYVNHIAAATTTHDDQPALPPTLPSPGSVARVRHSDIFPSVPKVESIERESLMANGPPVPPFPNLAADSSAGGPQPRRLETAFANHQIPPPEQQHQQQQQQQQSPKQQPQPQQQTLQPVLSPSSPEKSPRSKSAPPSRPPLPPGPPPLTQVAEAPEARESGNRSFAARPKPALLSPNELNVGVKSPSVSQPTSPASRPTDRQELLRSFHKYDDVNLIQILAQQKKECGEAKRKVARLEDQVLKLTKEKVIARDLEIFLVKVKEEGEEAALQWAQERLPESFAHGPLLDLPSTLFHAMSNNNNNNNHHHLHVSPRRSISFLALSPTTSSSTTAASTNSSLKRIRVPTPYPKRSGLLQQQPSSQPIQKDSEEYLYLVEAAKCVPVEYVSEMATIFVRCPYGARNDQEEDPWQNGVTAIATVAEDEYIATADAYQPDTVQVVAKILADASLLILTGSSTVRYKRSISSNEADDAWKTLADEDTSSTITSLGTVMYIDGDANEKEYSLDEIFEAAISTRETYCSSVIATAAGFMAMKMLENNTPRHSNTLDGTDLAITDNSTWSKPPAMMTPAGMMAPAVVPQPSMLDQAVGTDVPELVDECVGTEDLPFPTETKKPKKKVPLADACIGTEEPWPTSTPAVKPRKVPTTDACVGTDEIKYEPSVAPSKEQNIPAAVAAAAADNKAPTHDLLSVLIAMMFTNFFWLIWMVVFWIPFQLLKYTTILLLIWGILTLAWLYFADDHGAEALGATPLPFYNHYGIV